MREPTAFAVEHWAHSHVQDVEGRREYTVFAVFGLHETGAVDCTWGVVDASSAQHRCVSVLDPMTPQRIVDGLSGSALDTVPEGHLVRALKSGVWMPNDRVARGAAAIAYGADGKLGSVVVDDGTCKLEMDGGACNCKLTLRDSAAGLHAELTFRLKAASANTDESHEPVAATVDGFVRSIPDAMANELAPVETSKVEGRGCIWSSSSATLTDRELSHVDVTLDDGSILSVQENPSHDVGQRVALRKASTRDVQVLHDACLTRTPSTVWTSLRTLNEYPLHLRVSSEEAALDLQIACTIEAQEVISACWGVQGFYCGRATAAGTVRGEPVTGVALVRRRNAGTQSVGRLVDNYKRFVREAMAVAYPTTPDAQWVDRLIDGALAPTPDPRHVGEVITGPVRWLLDRGGKSWISLMFLSSVNALLPGHVDGARFLPLSELLHVGSLIIDDIEDGSDERRGVPAVHSKFGSATAINAGTMCCFAGANLASVDDLDDARCAGVHRTLSHLLRAAHLGQGLDIDGLERYMPHVAATGNTEKAFDALNGVHIGKTGRVCGGFCRIAAILARGTSEQQRAFDTFGTKTGLAFQIIDDARNLSDFEGSMKVGEDISTGKITYPLLKAMSVLEREDREALWAIVGERTHDTTKVAKAIDLMRTADAVDRCMADARSVLQEAWDAVDSVAPGTMLFVRAFSEGMLSSTR